LAALALTGTAGSLVLQAPQAHAIDLCTPCKSKCANAAPWLKTFLCGACNLVCGAQSAGNKIADTAKNVFEKIKDTVSNIAGKAIAFVKTGFQTAQQLWSAISNLEMPLIERWSTNKPSADLRPKIKEYGMPIKDQGQFSTCMANAMSNALEFALIPYMLKYRQLAEKVMGKGFDPHGFTVSRKELYYDSRHDLFVCSNGEGNFGSWSLNAASWVNHRGVAAEKFWPYTPWATHASYANCLDHSTDGPPPAADVQNRHFYIKEFHYLPGVPIPGKASIRRIEDVEAIIDRGYPVVITVFTWGGDKWNAPGGVVGLPATRKVFWFTLPTAAPDNAHYILLVGYDRAKKHFIFENSWGPTWGDKGFGYLPYEYVSKYSIEGLFIKDVLVK
jgi:hypothetical protein